MTAFGCEQVVGCLLDRRTGGAVEGQGDGDSAQCALDAGGEEKAAELAGVGRAGAQAIEIGQFPLQEVLEMLAGVGSFAVLVSVHGHDEGVATGVLAPADRYVDIVGQPGLRFMSDSWLAMVQRRVSWLRWWARSARWRRARAASASALSMRSGLPVGRALTSLKDRAMSLISRVSRRPTWEYLWLHDSEGSRRHTRRALGEWPHRLVNMWPGQADAFVYFDDDPGGAALCTAAVLAPLIRQSGRYVSRIRGTRAARQADLSLT